MQDKISNEELARTFSAYPRCKVISKQSGREYAIVGFKNLDGTNPMIVCEKQKDCEVCIYPDRLQLILRPLSSISMEECLEVAKLAKEEVDPKDATEENSKRFAEALCEMHQKEGFPVCITDYLRSIGIDLGYGSIPSLIASNIAIEKEVRNDQ